MALIINSPLKNQEGFETSQSLVFVNFIFTKNATMAQLEFFRTKVDFKNGLNSFFQEQIPTNFDLNIPRNVFWGGGANGLIQTIHLYLKNELEKITGTGTVSIIQDPYS